MSNWVGHQLHVLQVCATRPASSLEYFADTFNIKVSLDKQSFKIWKVLPKLGLTLSNRTIWERYIEGRTAIKATADV